MKHFAYCVGLTKVATHLLLFAALAAGTNTFAQAPANDACADAIPLTLNTGWVASSNANTVVNGPNLSCGGNQLVKDVWFSFTFTGGTLTILTQLGTLADTRIGVRAACTSTVLACNDDASGVGLASRLILGCDVLTVGETYLIQAGGYQLQTGTFSIRLDTENVDGCTDVQANNYNPCATVEDGSCAYDVLQAAFQHEALIDCDVFGVVYTSESVGNIQSLSWSFPGGEPATSADQQVVVVYPVGGIYSATLVATELGGAQATMSQNIEVQAQRELDIQIDQDNFPGETSWKLFNQMGLEIAAGGATGTLICIDAEQCHQFVIYDTYGDGICCAYGEGSYTLLLDGVEVATGGLFGFEEATSVNCPPASDCNNAIAVGLGTHAAPLQESWFTFTPDTSGQFLITTCDLTTCPTTIWIYDYCNMANFDDSNAATFTFNDGFCGDQAEITNVMAADTEYFIRVRWEEDPAAPCAKELLIDYLGPIVGCTNPAACNYQPLAAVSGPCFFNDDPECSELGPDLSVRDDVYLNSMFLTTINATDACLVEEGCVQGFGQRQVVRFTTYIDNIGNQDYFIGVPTANNPQFEYDPCHNHYHYEGYAEYVLFDGDGYQMPEIGFKNGFCVLDLTCPNGGQAKFSCGNMGITAGCADYYGSSLACQWVDITDVPAGSYTMVVRVNWDQSPDAAGRYELRYDNNWAAVCITFERDANNNIINFTKSLDCVIPIDCIGQPFGSSIPDCTGQCAGTAHVGNLNANPELQVADVDLYMSGIVENGIETSPCTDVNNDGSISVMDAALVSDCVINGEEQADETGIHNHCIFGIDLVNPADLVTFSLGNLNTEAGYFDLFVLNPDCKIVGFEFLISGAQIASVENLVSADLFTYNTAISLTDNRVVALSQVPHFLIKQYSPYPLMRIYYSALTGDEICISEIVDVVNEDYHGVITAAGPCVSALAEGSIIGSVAWPAGCGNRDMNIEMRSPDTGATLFTMNTVLTAEGTFTTDAMPAGTYDIRFKVVGALSQVFNGIVISPGTTSVTLNALQLGDINGDNAVNLPDISVMNASWGSQLGQPNYNPIADLSCDGNVNLIDASLLNITFGMTGAAFE